MVNNFILLQSLKSIDEIPEDERGAFVWGSILTVVITILFIHYFFYKPQIKKIKGMRPENKKLPLYVKDEVDYTDYINWAAKVNEKPFFKKRRINP